MFPSAPLPPPQVTITSESSKLLAKLARKAERRGQAARSKGAQPHYVVRRSVIPWVCLDTLIYLHTLMVCVLRGVCLVRRTVVGVEDLRALITAQAQHDYLTVP